jgi:hypothetical protein
MTEGLDSEEVPGQGGAEDLNGEQDARSPDGGAELDVDAALAEVQEQEVARGDALTPRESFSVAAASRATVVVFAGHVGSGKTTLMTSLYERLGRGPVAGRFFAGSRTLPGFERRCHLGRVASGLASPDTQRTTFDALPWLHLRTAAADNYLNAQTLLLGDFYGEHFSRLVAGTTKASELPFLRRADHVCLMINGEKMASDVSRVHETQASTDLLKALLEDQTLASPRALSLVVTKLDVVNRAGRAAQDEVDALCTALAGEVRREHPNIDVPIVLTAARSTISALPLGHGLEELVALWVDRPQIQLSHEPPPIPAQQQSAFDLFLA